MRGLKMKRRHIAIGLGCLVLICVAICVQYEYRPFQKIGALAYNRIEIGMSVLQVEEVIGLPPGNYGSHDRSGGTFSRGSTGHEVAREGNPDLDNEEISRLSWWGEYYAIRIELD